jgi:outer membrane receptor for ferrienterochelin and colicins
MIRASARRRDGAVAHLRGRRRRVATLTATCLVVLLDRSPVSAQSVDYSDFEQLLGEPVTTSATGKPQRMSEVPANMEIITADDIRRSGADNIPDILEFVAGIDVRRYGFAAADVGIRGYNEASNPRLLVLVNGQQVYLDDVGRTQWYTLPVTLEEIRQIEIVKGPNTALFGFNAVSGVINIITYDPMVESVNTVTARGGTQDYSALSATGTGRIADVGGLRLSADGFRAQEFAPAELTPADLAFRQSPQRNAFDFDARAQASSNVEVFFSGALVQTRTWEPTAYPLYETDYQRTNWFRAGLSADTSIGLLGFSVYRNELLSTYSNAAEYVDVSDAVIVAQVNDLVKLNPYHTIRVELDYRNNTASSTVVGGKVGYDVYSAGAMWDWQITPSLSLTNAVRYDHFMLNQNGSLFPTIGFTSSDFNNATIDAPSLNSGLVWKANTADTFRFLVAHGSQLPSIFDLGIQYRTPATPETPSIVYLGNPGLRPSSVNNVEFDWDHALHALGSTFRAAFFAQRTDNVISSPYDATPGFDGMFLGGLPELRSVASNVGYSTAVGTELGIKGHSPSGFRWNASYSFISITDHLAINQGGIFSPQNYAQGTPTDVLVLGGGYTYQRWEFDLQSRWQSWFVDYRPNTETGMLMPVRVGNYLTADARAAYRLTDNVTLALSAQQFNVSHLLVSEGPPVERRVFLTLTLHL